jgi:hypothetical protein
MAVTRKGRLKCGSCGAKQSRSDTDVFLVVNGWAPGFDDVRDDDGFDIELSHHFCTWACLGERVFRQATQNIEPEQITGD